MYTTNGRNNFDFLRFSAASMVWYWHCFALTGKVEPTAIDFGALGVAIFFVISGYLITQSFDRNPDCWRFLCKRLLRIVPALFVCILVTVFFIAPLTTSLYIPDFFGSHITWRYLRCILIFPIQYELPGVFDGNYSQAVNGSLWTLQHEMRLYIAVAIIGCIGLLRARWIAGILSGIIALRLYGVVEHLQPQDAFVFHKQWGDIELASRLAMQFAAGSLLYLLRDRIAARPAYFIIAIIAAWCALHWLPSAVGNIAFELIFSYLMICFAFMTIPALYSFGHWGDFSYGFYLYAFVMQQVALQALGAHASFTTFMLASFIASIICAIFSWYCVERPILSLKRTKT